MHRAGYRKKCASCKKLTFTSFKKAIGLVGRTDAERVYWCPEAGGYHITGIPKPEWDAAQARRDALVYTA